MTTICSGVHPAGLAEYGHRFIDSFAQLWPQDVGLLFYTEEPTPLPRGENRSVWDCPGAADFYARHRDDPVSCGRKEGPKPWPRKHRDAGYSFRFDAVRFFKQIMIPEHASFDLPDGEILAWFDADVVTYRQVPALFVEGLLGDADLCKLGRSKQSTEIGFWAIRLNSKTRAFLKDMNDLYRSDGVFDLAEWHSGFVFDHCTPALEERGGRVRNLTKDGKGHVWFACPDLARYTDHCKGPRKGRGFSKERFEDNPKLEAFKL